MQNKLAIDVAIFDLDGTLVDSKDDITYAFNETLREFGLSAVKEEVIADFVGTGIRPLMKQIIPEGSKVEYAALVKRFEEVYAENLSRQTRLFAGMTEVLNHWAGKQKYILTNKLQFFTDKLVRELDILSYFRGVYGRDAFERSKPDPLPIQEICRLSSADTARVVMIGDTPVDVMAGKAAGVTTIGVTWGYCKQSLLEASHPDYMIQSPAELLSIVL